MISAFAVEETAMLLFLNLFLLPIFIRNKELIPTFIATLVLATFSYVYFSLASPKIIEEGDVKLHITWADNVKINGGSVKGFAKVSSGETIYASYQFTTEEEKEWFQQIDFPEQIFSVEGTFQPIPKPAHAYAFNMAYYLKMYGASGIFEVEKIREMEEKRSFYRRLLMQRKKMKEHIHRTFPQSLVVEAEALLIGDRSGMDEETAANYRTLGITHLFAISGLHVGLLVFIVRECLLRCRLRKESVDIFLLVFLPLYATIAGSAPSVWRAVIVSMLILLTMYSRMTIRLDSILAIAAIGFIFVKPFVVFQPGFQLSYLAALSLILSSRILMTRQSKLRLSFLVTTITQIALYPVLLFHFFELSLSSFFMNLLYVPLYSVIILPMNLLLLLFSLIAQPVANCLFFFYEPCRGFIDQVTIYLGSLPYQLWIPGKPTMVGIVLSLGGVLWFFILYEKRKSMLFYLPPIFIPALFIQFAPYFDSELRVTYVDVGQGDGIVIELPYKRATYLIDTGGSFSFGEANWKTPTQAFEVGRQVIVPYLKGRGITTVDKLIISHGHLDHMGSAHEIVEEVNVKEIHITPNSGGVNEMEKLVKIAGEQGIPILEKRDGDGWTQNDSQFYYLGPQNEHYVGNDSSLILFMKTEALGFLFMGDAEVEGERLFLAKYKEVDFGQVILKAGHHGSKTSSTEAFVAAIQPMVAIVSAGRNNRYNHPNEEVLETFSKYKIPVLVTAQRHSITVHVRKDKWSISSIQ